MSTPRKKPRSLWTTTVVERQSPLEGLCDAAPSIVVSAKTREQARQRARELAEPFRSVPTDEFLSKRTD